MNEATSISTNVTHANASSLAHSTAAARAPPSDWTDHAGGVLAGDRHDAEDRDRSCARCQPPRLRSMTFSDSLSPSESCVQRAIVMAAISGPRPACATNASSSDQRVERSDQSLVHSERITRGSVTRSLDRSLRRDGGGGGGAHCSASAPAVAPTGIVMSVAVPCACWNSTESLVMLMNASSSDTWSGVSSCSTSCCAAAISPISSDVSPKTCSAPSSSFSQRPPPRADRFSQRRPLR